MSLTPPVPEIKLIGDKFARTIAGPWPTYTGFADMPERERWVLYGSAKAYRASLESQGFVMAESYDDFVRRVTRELEI